MDEWTRRLAAAVSRGENATARDGQAAQRDETARDRDRQAERSDRQAEEQAERGGGRLGPGIDAGRATRRCAAQDRQMAAGDRQRAVEDRQRAACERDQLRLELGHAQRLEEGALELERSNTALKEFASVVAHDLNSPMSSTAGFALLIEEHYAGRLDARGREWLKRIINGIDRGHALIENLLAHSAIGGAEVTLEPLDTGGLMDEVLIALEEVIEADGTQVRVGPLPTVLGDRAQLQRLFQNLISNAVKYGARAGPRRVEVSAESQGDRWRFSVADNGVGIPRAERQRVFEPFTRVGDGGSLPGTGIGLAISQGIVERHGGEIHVEPGLDGGGTSFVFTIPRAPLATPAAQI
jgi:signal transduction histidine kinase